MTRPNARMEKAKALVFWMGGLGLVVVVGIVACSGVISMVVSELRRRSALEEMIQQNATQKLFRQEFLKGTYDLMKIL